MTDSEHGIHEMIDAFLANRLSDTERAVVETRIVADASFRHEVELSAAMRDGLRELEKQGKVAPLLHRTGIWPRSPIAIAASVLAIAVGVAAFLFSQRTEHKAQEMVLASLHFEQTRGTDAAAVVWQRTAAPTLLDLHFDVGIEPAPSYDVLLERVGNGADETVLSAKSIPIGQDGLLTISIQSSTLAPGDYRIRLEPRQSGPTSQEPVTYTLRIAD